MSTESPAHARDIFSSLGGTRGTGGMQSRCDRGRCLYHVDLRSWYRASSELMNPGPTRGNDVPRVVVRDSIPPGGYAVTSCDGCETPAWHLRPVRRTPRTRPEGRAADAAPGWLAEHEKPSGPWGIRPRGPLLSHLRSALADSRGRRIAGDLESGIRGRCPFARPKRARLLMFLSTRLCIASPLIAER